MKIDNRIFIIPASPFVLWIWARVFWWFAGLEWDPGIDGAFAVMFSGVMLGAYISIGLLIENITLGHFYIGRRKDK